MLDVMRSPLINPILQALFLPLVCLTVQLDAPLLHAEELAETNKGESRVMLQSENRLVQMGSSSRLRKISDQHYQLHQGTAIFDQSGGLGSSSLKISIPTHQIQLRKGTAVVEYKEGGYLKVICLSGKITLKTKSFLGEFVEIKAGEMMLVNPAEKVLPEPVEVNLERFIRSSSLVKAAQSNLPNTGKMGKASSSQKKKIDSGEAVNSSLVIAGRGTAVSVASGTGSNTATLTATQSANQGVAVTVAATSRTPLDPQVRPMVGLPEIAGLSPIPTRGGSSSPTDPTTQAEPSKPVQPTKPTEPSRPTDPQKPIDPEKPTEPTEPPFTPPGPVVRYHNGDYVAGTTTVLGKTKEGAYIYDTTSKAPLYEVKATPALSQFESKSYHFAKGTNLDLSTLDKSTAFVADQGSIVISDGATVAYQKSIKEGNLSLKATGDVSLQTANVSTAPKTESTLTLESTSGNVSIKDSKVASSNTEIRSHRNVTIENSSLQSTTPGTGKIEVNSHSSWFGFNRSVSISGSKIGTESAPAEINISATSKPIIVSNSSELKALAKISVATSSRGRIETTNASFTVTSANGVAEFNSPYTLQFQNTSINAATIKASTYGANSTITIGNNVRMTASKLIQLFAPTSTGTIRFDGSDIVLDGPTIHMKANRVEVTSGTNVNNKGRTYIEANHHRYNSPGRGSFQNAVNQNMAPP